MKSINKKKFKYGTLATVFTIVVVAIIVLINVILTVVSDKVDMKIDLTQDKIFAISQDTIDYLDTLNSDVSIVAMASEDEFKNSQYVYFKQAYEVLKKYTENSDKISLDFVDMTENPTYAEQFKALYKGEITQYSIIVRCGERMKVFGIQDLYNTEVDYNTYQQKIVSSKAEQVITSAIMYVTDPSPIKATIMNLESAGAGSDNITTMLDRNGYEVSSIDPLSEYIPEDTTLLVINAPLNDYPDELISSVETFLENGGNYGKNLLYIADSGQNLTPNLDSFLARWGIQIGTGIVCETEEQMVISKPYEVKSLVSTDVQDTYGQNIVNKNLSPVSYYSRPVNVLFDSKGLYRTIPVLSTADTSYILTQELFDKYQNGDKSKPATSVQNTIVASEKTSDKSENKSTVLAVGSSYIFSTTYTESTYTNNGELFVSAINYMTGKSAGITIVPKDFTTQRFEMTQERYNACRNVFVYIIPGIVIIVGAVVCISRRRKG